MTSINLLSSSVLSDPYGSFEQLRDAGPVVRVDVAGENLWLVLSYQAACFVLTNPGLFSSREALSSRHVFRHHAQAAELLRTGNGYPRRRTLILTDPPEHTRYRAVMKRAFDPGFTVRTFLPRIREIVRELIDAFVDARECEFVSEFAYPLPMQVIGQVLDVSASEIGLLKRWSDDFIAVQAGNVEEDRVLRAAQSTVEFEEYFSLKLEDRRRHPRDDFLSRLVQPLDEGAPLSCQELLSLIQQTLVGGNETTTNLLGNAMWLLVNEPGLADRIRRDGSTLDRSIEEILRRESPLQGLFRVATRDVEVVGVNVPAGAKLMVHFGAANRDPSQFPDDDFNADRPNIREHLAFGRGVHSCLGQMLARQEARVALDALLRRLDGLRVDPVRGYRRNSLFGFRGFERLWIEFESSVGRTADETEEE